MDRQRLDVEDVDEEQDPEQNQLAPLGVVAEKETEILEHELALGRRQPVEGHTQGTAERPPHLPLASLLRLGIAGQEESAVRERAEREGGRRRAPERNHRT